MSDDTSTTGEKTEAEPIGGERLRAARRARDISVRDVAKELHLDEEKVRALERNEFDVLGAPVFAKGHLRKYAELVGVAIDDVMTDYYQMNRASGVPPIIGPRRERPRDLNLGPWLGGGLILIVILAAAYWWLVVRSTTPVASVAPSRPVPVAVRTEVQADEGALPADSSQPATDTVVEETAEVQASEATDAGVTARESATNSYEPAPGVAQIDVELAFTGECWTEISDASGRRLFYDLGQEGRVVALSGAAPLHVILGDANNVSITVDGREWPIPASARRGRLARLTIAR